MCFYGFCNSEIAHESCFVAPSLSSESKCRTFEINDGSTEHLAPALRTRKMQTSKHIKPACPHKTTPNNKCVSYLSDISIPSFLFLMFVGSILMFWNRRATKRVSGRAPACYLSELLYRSQVRHSSPLLLLRRATFYSLHGTNKHVKLNSIVVSDLVRKTVECFMTKSQQVDRQVKHNRRLFEMFTKIHSRNFTQVRVQEL